MPYRFNPATGRVEDENGIPAMGGNPLSMDELQNAVSNAGGGPGPGPQSMAPPGPLAGPMTNPLSISPGGPPPMQRESQRNSFSYEKPNPMEASALEGVNAGYDAQTAVARKAAEEAQRMAMVEAEGQKQIALGAQEREQGLTDTLDAQKAEMAKGKATYQAEMQRLAQMQQIPDYYEGRTGTKIFHALMIGLGQFGASLQGSGQNTALSIIKGAEEDYYRKAQRQIEGQSKIVDRAREDWQQLAGPGKQDAINDWSLKSAARMDALTAKTKAAAQANGTDHALIEGDKIVAMLQQKKAEYGLQYAQGLRKKFGGESTSVQGTGAPAGVQAQNADRNVYGPGGVVIAQANTPKEAAAVNQGTQAWKSLDQLLGALQDSYQKDGKLVNPFGEAHSSREAIRGQAVLAFKEAAKLGAIQGADMGLIDKAIGGGWTGDQAVQKLSTARGAMTRNAVNFIDSQGLPGERIVMQLARGPSSPAQPAPGAPGAPQQGAGGVPPGAVRVQVTNRAGQLQEAYRLPDGSLWAP